MNEIPFGELDATLPRLDSVKMGIERYAVPEDFKNHPHLKHVTKYWEVGEKYQVLYDGASGFKHLRVRRFDDKPICDFMDLQEIKNNFFGEWIVAVQVFPKQEDFVDGSNTYHLWVVEGELPNLKTLYEYNGE